MNAIQGFAPCCDRPQIQTMDYDKFSPDEWNHPDKRINRICSRCLAHWFGPVGAVKFYTRAEWDCWIGAVKIECRKTLRAVKRR